MSSEKKTLVFGGQGVFMMEFLNKIITLVKCRIPGSLLMYSQCSRKVAVPIMPITNRFNHLHTLLDYGASIKLTPFSIPGRYVITVYGDVYNDQEFFGKTYPWIIDNIGGEVTVDFYLQGSGKYSVPQMCVLNELKMNTFLQAQYLKCEAEDNPSDKCICETGIDQEKYKSCVHTKGNYAGLSSAKYTQLGIDASPIIEIGYKNTIFGVEDNWYLKKICTIFGDDMPRGCIKPFSCSNSSTISSRKGLVVYNCSNCKETNNFLYSTTPPDYVGQ